MQHIGGILVVALLFLTILPGHFHVHHTDTEHHQHQVDLHFNQTDMGSSHHDQAQILEAAPDGVMKLPVIKIFPFLVLTVLTALIAVSTVRVFSSPGREVFIPAGHRSHHSPPLRGPPVS